jgi:broad specificity phosphatase PhoE
MTKIVYFVRHGETYANKNHLVNSFDVELTEHGLVQADTIGKRCAHLGVDTLLVSDMVRTKQTADAIRRYVDLEPIYSSLLREYQRPKDLAGMSLDSEEYKTFLTKEAENLDNPSWRQGDGEIFIELRDRVRESLKFILKQNEDSVLVVTHGHFLRTVVVHVLSNGEFTGEQWLQLSRGLLITNTGITVLKHDDTRWKLLTWNDHAHLG